MHSNSLLPGVRLPFKESCCFQDLCILLTGLTLSFLRLTTCCHTFLNSSTRTGLIRKSTAPCVTPRSTTLVSPLDDITAEQRKEFFLGLHGSSDRHPSQIIANHKSVDAQQRPMWLTDDWEIHLQPHLLQQSEAIHVCSQMREGHQQRAREQGGHDS